MKKKQFFLIAITILIHMLCIGLGLLDLTDFNLVFNIIGAIFMICSIYLFTGNFSNIVFLFVVFSVMYGLGGPITVRYGEGLNSIFGEVFYIDKFLIAYDLATIGLLIGIVVYTFLKKRTNEESNITFYKNQININTEKFINISVIACVITGIFEIINFINVGGISVLIQGKAVYQAAISKLPVAMPVDMFACLTVAIMSLYISACRENKQKISKPKIIISIIAMLPYFLIEILLGKRGRLIALILIAFLGFTYLKPLKKISKSLVITGVVLYLIMVFLYANRGIVSLLFKDPQQFVEKAFSSERIVSALNPRWW